MPLIPAPPMPTKWTRLTLCFIARRPERDARVGDASRRVGARDLARGDRHREQRFARVRGEPLRQPLGRELRLRNLRRRARVDEELRVGALLVGDRAGQRHDDRADADRGELGDRRRAAAADDEIGFRVARGHVVDERDALRRRRRRRGMRRAQRVDVLLARLMHDPRPRARRAAARAPSARARSSRPRRGCRRRRAATARPSRPAKRTSGGGIRPNASRTGLPTHSTLRA